MYMCMCLIVTAPSIVEGSQYPLGDGVPSFQKRFTVKFDQEIFRSPKQRFIHIVRDSPDGSGGVIDSIGSMSPRISVNGHELRFYLGNETYLEDDNTYYVIMDLGVVVGGQTCKGNGIPHLGIHDKSVWNFTTEAAKPCTKNDGRGDCQHQCQPTGNRYLCLCEEGYYLGQDSHSCFMSGVKCKCKHGVCRGGGVCECVVGWKGKTCAIAHCYLQNECSGNGHCVAPGTCACKIGWGGPACNVDLCTVKRTCDSCTKQIGCGWCNDQQKCVAGSGEGPKYGRCRSWIYYTCLMAVNSLQISQSQAKALSVLECARKCMDFKKQRTQGLGSYQFCSDYATVCGKYASCFEQSGNRITWKEDKCRFGVMELQKESYRPNENRIRRQLRQSQCESSPRCPHFVCILEDRTEGITASLVDEILRVLAESNIFPDDQGLLRKASWVESEFGSRQGIYFGDDMAQFDLPTGIWQMTQTMLDKTKDADVFADTYDQISDKFFNIIWEDIEYEDLNKPLIAALAVRLYLQTFEQMIPSTDSDQADFWYRTYHGETDNLNVNIMTREFLRRLQQPIFTAEPENERESCVHGFADDNCKCVCEYGWSGPMCDEPDCNTLHGCRGADQCTGANFGM